MIKAGIVGMGVIGQHIAKAIDNGIPGVTLAGVSVRTATTAGGFAAYPLDELIRKADLIVEGGYAGGAARLRPRRAHRGQAPHGAVGGRPRGRPRRVGAARRAAWLPHPRALGCHRRARRHEGRARGRDHRGHHGDAQAASRPRGAPWIVEQRIDLDAITGETLLFEGPAARAVKAFPANVNVVAALSLAGIGPERTHIKIFAVPGQARNQHRITIEGSSAASASRSRTFPPTIPAPASSPTSPPSRC